MTQKTSVRIMMQVPGAKEKGAILMDYKRRILEMLEQINEPCILEKIYWYVQRLLLRK